MYSRGHNFQTLNLEYFGEVSQPVPGPNQGQNVGVRSTNSRHRVAPLQKATLQMNLCLVCNTAFVIEKGSSKDAGLFCFFNLCNLLQVPSYQEFVPEYHPLCTKCSGAVDEYITLQNKIKELMNKLGEMRKLLGTQLVDSYEGTPISMKNFPVKTKLYKIWHSKIYGGKSKVPTVVEGTPTKSTSPNNNSTENVDSQKNNDLPQVNEEQQQRTENQGPPNNYTLLDISNNSVSSSAFLSNSNHGAASGAGSVADVIVNDHENDNNSNLSMDCHSPASPPPFDDAPSDHEGEVYVKNYNGEASNSGTDPASNLKTENYKAIQDGGSEANSSMTGGQRQNIICQEQQWIDKRKFRPIISTQRRNHPCKFCGKLFPAIFSLQMHERTHTGEKPFKCRICDRAFAAKAAMQKHELTHDKSRYEGEPKYECDLCGRKYHLERSLYTHKREHMGIKRFKRIRKKYPKKKKPKDPNAPPKARRPAVRKEGLPKRPSRKRVQKVKLDEAGNPIPEEPKPKRRKRSPKPPSNRPKRTYLFPRRKPGALKEPHNCQQCGKEFPDRYRLGKHILTHTGEKPLKCPFPECPKSFAIKGNLDKHMRTHDKSRFEGEPAHTCEYCGKGFYVLGTLYHHRRKKHLGLEDKYLKHSARRKEPRQCNLCGKQLCSLYALSHHKLMHHGGGPKFNCEICGKPFYKHSDALDHAKRHEPTWMLKKYFRITCSGCPPEALAFQSKLAIREHWAKEHKDQPLPDVYKKPPKPKVPYKPGHYVCTLCPEDCRPTYGRSGALLKHKKSFHSGKSNKKWKPRGMGGGKGTKRRNQSEDEMSTSGDSSEDENIDFDKEPEKLAKPESVPTRRSVRQTRANISNIASLLEDSDHEPEEDVIAATPRSVKRFRFIIVNKNENHVLSSNSSKRQKKPTASTSKKTQRSVSKLTDSYINKLLGGRYVCVALTRVAVERHQHQESTTGRSTRNRNYLNENSSINPALTKSPPVKNVARRRGGRSPGKRNVIEASSNDPFEPVLINEAELGNVHIVTEETEQDANEMLEDPLADVKQEADDDQEGSDSLHRSTLSNITAKRPNFSIPMVIHNPLIKNKAANPMVLSSSATAPNSGSERSSKKTYQAENAATDNEENETVLGF